MMASFKIQNINSTGIYFDNDTSFTWNAIDALGKRLTSIIYYVRPLDQTKKERFQGIGYYVKLKNPAETMSDDGRIEILSVEDCKDMKFFFQTARQLILEAKQHNHIQFEKCNPATKPAAVTEPLNIQQELQWITDADSGKYGPKVSLQIAISLIFFAILLALVLYFHDHPLFS